MPHSPGVENLMCNRCKLRNRGLILRRSSDDGVRCEGASLGITWLGSQLT